MRLPSIEELQANLRVSMARHKIKASDLARKCNMSKATVSKILAGKLKNYETIRKVSEALDQIVVNEASSETIQEIMIRRVVALEENDSVANAKKIMLSKNFSQLPVITSDGVLRGLVTEQSILFSPEAIYVRDALSADYAVVSPDKAIDETRQIIRNVQALLIQSHGKLLGIVTKSDFLK